MRNTVDIQVQCNAYISSSSQQAKRFTSIVHSVAGVIIWGAKQLSIKQKWHEIDAALVDE